jgi:hypothetical protein
MAKKQPRIFYFENEANAFYPGETIKGRIHFISICEATLNDIELSFNVAENWLYGTDYAGYGNNVQTIGTLNLNITKLLNSSKDYINLTKKAYFFPFEYYIPSNIAPSFEYPTTKFKAFRRYILSATLKSPSLCGTTTTYVIIKASPKIETNNLEVEQSLAIKKWGLFKQGNTKLKAFYSPSFGVNEPIVIKVNIDNSESKLKVKECKLILMRNIIFKDSETKNNKWNSEEILAKKVIPSIVKKKEIKDFEFKFELNELKNTALSYSGYFNPYDREKQCNMIYTPSCEGDIVVCQYAIKITAYYESFVKKKERPRIMIPICLVHQSGDSPNMIIEDNDEDFQRAIEESKREEEERQKRINESNNNNLNQNNNINNANNDNQVNNMYPSFDDNQKYIDSNNNNNINENNNNANNNCNNNHNQNTVDENKGNNIKYKDINKIDSDNDDSDGENNFNLL